MCKQCGNCCRDIILPLGMTFDEDDIRWIEYHGIKVIDKDGKQWIKILNQCDKLIDNKCSIHNNRPETCQIFICK